MSLQSYQQFIDRKSQADAGAGFEPVFMPDFLFPFQAALLDWSIRKGRSAILADCGLGKTPMELVWAENVIRHTNGNVLLLTPTAVGGQMVEEAEKFGIEVNRSRDSGIVHRGITITNYEQLHKFSPPDFAGVICDESSILKSFDGKRRGEITAFMRKTPYRLLATATAAPNDYIELGTSSEALSYLGYVDMLARFFKNDQNNSAQGRKYGEVIRWRFKGHAELPFWRWICSWARAMRKPSDLGFDDALFVLPDLVEREHIVKARTRAPGMLFELPAIGLDEQREERKRTINERCEMVASLVETDKQALVWCHSNEEGNLLERLIDGSVQVAGRHDDNAKEEGLLGFAHGEVRVLITKPKICAWGMNFQRCNHVTFFPSHSFEQYYQGIRRCWRFGQTKPVHVDIVTTEGELGVLKNLQRKQAQADRMFDHLVREMANALSISRGPGPQNDRPIPSWLCTIQ